MMQVRGEGGTLLVGHQLAATVGGWQLADRTLRFTVVGTDPYWSSKSPTTAVLRFGRATWRATLVRADLRCGVAEVGDLEMR